MGNPILNFPAMVMPKHQCCFQQALRCHRENPSPRKKPQTLQQGFSRFSGLDLWDCGAFWPHRVVGSGKAKLHQSHPCHPVPFHPFPTSLSTSLSTSLKMPVSLSLQHWAWAPTGAGPLPVDAPLGVQQMCLKACLQDQCCVFRVHYFKYTVKVNT